MIRTQSTFPVFIQQPANFAPRDKARTAGFDKAPKLMPEILNNALVE